MTKTLMALLIATMLFMSVAIADTPDEVQVCNEQTLNVVGTAHLDTQWRWTIKETIEEYIPATVRDNLKLMDIYPDYVFSFEGAFKYMLLKEYYPEEYARLKPYIEANRWRVTGSWVDPVDVNMPSCESLIRHTLYGNGYFQSEFGKESRDIFLPDCFGFGYALPSIANHCGLKSFSTQKLTWGSAVPVPFDIGLWQGVDGSKIIAALKPGSYVSEIRTDLSSDSAWAEAIHRQKQVSNLSAAYMYFGTGDTGGAPDSESVAWLDKSIRSDGPIQVNSIGADDIVDIVAANSDVNLPVYNGELLMTRHGVGCYSSQAAMKRWNRKNELLADAAERASVIAYVLAGAEYPRQALKDTWIRFLWHQFHDDLTGTSIPEAYQYSWNDELLCQNRFAGILTNAVEKASARFDTRVKGIPVIVYNSLAIPRQDIVEATVVYDGEAPQAVRVFNNDGIEVPSQIVGIFTDSIKLEFIADVPPVGMAIYDIREAKTSCGIQTDVLTEITDDSIVLKNNRYTVTINKYGDIESIYDMDVEHELLSQPLSFELLHDKPQQWPAWEIGYDDIISQPELLIDENVAAKVVEDGPVHAAVEITRHWGNSDFRFMISLASNGDFVGIDADIDWYEPETLLKVALKTTAPAESVTYDLGLGTIKRGLNHPKLYEVPGHQWADISSSEQGYGVAILNDCKYGWDHPDSSTLRLTLIHTPGIADGWSWVGDEKSQDMGHHRFAFAISGHNGSWQEVGIPWQAARLNQPLLAFQTIEHPGDIGKMYSFLDIQTAKPGEDKPAPIQTPQVMVSSIKMAENSDEIIVRTRELHGETADNIHINFHRPIETASEINGVEKPIGNINFEQSVLAASLTANQPKSFAIKLVDDMKPFRYVKQALLALPLNQDVVSLDSDRTNGDIDGLGYSLVGELMSDTIIYNNTPFIMGPKMPGAMNTVACDGQTITLAEGKLNRVILLATAVGGPAEGTFSFDKSDTTLWIQDYAEPLGQWNSRLVNGQFVEDPQAIAPAYSLRMPIAWVGTHRHNKAGENETYQYTYIYAVQLNVPENSKMLTLPDNTRIKVFAATMTEAGPIQVTSMQDLYDNPNNTIAKISAEHNSFLDSLTVELSSPIPGAIVHYTLDGSKPTEKSPVYQTPIILKETTTVKARAIAANMNDNYATSAKFTKLIPIASVEISNVQPGLECSYYEGEWSNLPDFGKLKPVKEMIVETIAIPEIARPEDYSLVMTGYVNIPSDGIYTFTISSDDGSALYIADSLLINNDGVHGAGEVAGMIALEAGLQPIKILMFQQKGDEALAVTIEGEEIEKQEIPVTVLCH